MAVGIRHIVVEYSKYFNDFIWNEMKIISHESENTGIINNRINSVRFCFNDYSTASARSNWPK